MAAGRRYLVTGGTSALGANIVRRLVASGHEVLFGGRNEVRGQALAAETGSKFVAGDLCDTFSRTALMGAAASGSGRIDGLVLAAGAVHVARASETSDVAWDALMETNLLAPLLLCRELLPLLAASRGTIVTVASASAAWAEMELGVYSIAKRCLWWLTTMLAIESAAHGVTANTVLPGDMSHAMTATVTDTPRRDLGAPPIPPTGALMTVDQVTAAVLFFLADESRGCSGAALAVDGGMQAALRAWQVHQ